MEQAPPSFVRPDPRAIAIADGVNPIHFSVIMIRTVKLVSPPVGVVLYATCTVE